MTLRELVHGCTFDDFLLAPQLSLIERRDPATIDLRSRLTKRLTLNRPIVSANMDTVTRAPMAIVMAEEGGIGIIDRGFRPGEIEPQVREVQIVKRSQHGIIRDPYTIEPDATVTEAAGAMLRSRVGTLVVVDGSRRLVGLLTERDIRFLSDSTARVAERMTPRDQLVLHEGELSLAAAERLMIDRKIKKLPLVAADGTLIGLITSRDLLRQRRLPFATRDDLGRLRVGAAIGARGDYLERAADLLRAGADVLVIDIAHGHSVVMERALAEVRERFPDAEVIAGQRGHGGGRAVSCRPRRQRDQSRHRTGRRLHHPHHHELRRPAAAGACRLPRGAWRRGADHRGRRHQAAWQHL